MGKVGFWALAAAAIAARLTLSTLGWNRDIEIFWAFTEALRRGESIYASTELHNYGKYGPPAPYLLLAIRSCAERFGFYGIGAFHFGFAAVLSLADLAAALLLRRWLGPVSALILLLSPVSLLITGYHSQLDGMVVLLGLLSWHLLVGPPGSGEARPTTARLLLSTVLFGLSLSLKHLLIVFPIWAWLYFRKDPPLRRWVFLLGSYGVWLATLLPWLIAPGTRGTVISDVIFYAGFYSNTLSDALTQCFVPFLVSRFSELDQASYRLFIAALMASGWYFAGVLRLRSELLVLYLVSFVCFANSMANQYLVLPVFALCFYPRSLCLWIYSLSATVVIVISRHNIGPLLHLPAISDERLNYAFAQVWLFLFLIHMVRAAAVRQRNGSA